MGKKAKRETTENTILSTTGKWMAAGCMHGDLLDEAAFRRFLKAKRTYKPRHMICLGDAFEFTALRKGATDDEKRIDIERDISWGLWAMEKMFEGIRGERWFLRGNHCERLWVMAENGSTVNRELACIYINEIEAFLKNHRVNMKPYCSKAGVIEINGCLFMHGYGYGINAAKDHLRLYHKDCVFVHTHRAEEAVGTGWPRPIVAVNAGMLQTKFPLYASRGTSVLSWTHAYAKGVFLADGTHTKELVTIT